MAKQTYTVKSGDTLGALAKQYKVGLDNISGYKSGDPNKIGVGEVLTIDGSSDGSTDTTGGNKEATDYAGTVKSELNGDGSSKTSGSATTDDYLAGLRTKIDTTRTDLGTKAKSLEGLKTSTYNDIYEKKGLSAKKDEISSVDEQIAAKRALRDEAVAKVKANPGLSAATMTGQIGKLLDKTNAEINNLIANRNTLAGDYNTGLSEVEKESGNAVGDATTGYNTVKDLLASLTGEGKDYQSTLIDTLKQSNLTDYQDKQLAVALMNAETAARKVDNPSTKDTAWKLAISPLTGKPIYWYNSDGETRSLTAEDVKNYTSGNNPQIDNADGTTPAADSTQTDNVDNRNWFKRMFNIGG